MPKGAHTGAVSKGLNPAFEENGFAAERQAGARTNTHRFLSFNQRVALVDVSHDVHRSGGVKLAPTHGHHSFFQERLAAWTDLNCTQHFIDFARHARPLCQTLPLLLHHRAQVVALLVEHLAVPSSNAAVALLDMCGVLARDLREEFWQHFPAVLRSITAVLATGEAASDVPLIEAAFKCTAFLCKFLLQQLLRSPEELLGPLRPLLAHRREHMRKFAAESVAFLLRKLDPAARAALLERLLAPKYFMDANDAVSAHLSDGVAQIIFETMRGVDHRLHSVAAQVLPATLQLLEGVPDVNLNARRHAALRAAMDLLCQHVRPHSAKLMFEAVSQQLQDAGAELMQEVASSTAKSSRKTKHRGGARERSVSNSANRVLQLLDVTAQLAKHRLTVVAASENVTTLWTSLRKLISPRLLDACDGPHAELTRVLSTALSAIRSILQRVAGSNHASADGEVDAAGLEICRQQLAGSAGLLSVLAGQFSGSLAVQAATHPFFLQLTEWAHFDCVLTDQLTCAVEHVLICKSPATLNGALQLLFDVRQRCPEAMRQTRLEVRDEFSQLLLTRSSQFLSEDSSADSQTQATSICVTLRVAGVVTLDKPSEMLQTVKRLRSQYTPDDAQPDTYSSSDLRVPAARAIQADCLAAESRLLRDYFPKQLASLAERSMQMASQWWFCPLFLDALATVLSCLGAEGTGRISADWHKLESPSCIWKTLAPSTASPVRDVRIAALRALSLLPIAEQTGRSAVNNMLHASEVTLSAEHSRDAAVQINAVTEDVKHERLSEQHLAIVPYFVCGLLKTKFSAVWPAGEQLMSALCATADFAPVWADLLSELIRMQNCDTGCIVSELSTPATDDDDDSLPWASFDTQCVDYSTYHKNLLHMFRVITRKVEACNRDLVVQFLEFVQRYRAQRERSSTPASSAMDEDNAGAADAAGAVGHRTSKSTSNACLSHWLALFASFVNPKVFVSSEQMYEIFVDFLSKSEAGLQQLALGCVLSYKYPKTAPYADMLKGLVAEKSFRDTLSGFNLGLVEDDGSIVDDHREALIPVVVRILYGKMHTRQSRSAKYSLCTRRATILAAMTALPVAELSQLIDLVLQPYGTITLQADAASGPLSANAVLATVTAAQRSGLLHMVQSLVSQLGHLIESYMDRILTTITVILQSATHTVDVDRNLNTHAHTAALETRGLCLKRIAQIIQMFPAHDYSGIWPTFLNAVQQLVETLPTAGTQTQHPTGILLCLHTMSEHDELANATYFVPSTAPAAARAHSARMITGVIECIGVKSLSTAVVDVLLNTIQNLLDRDEALDTSFVHLSRHFPRLLEMFKDRIELMLADNSMQSKQGKQVNNPQINQMIEMLSKLCTLTTNSTHVTGLAKLLLPFLKSPKTHRSAHVNLLTLLDRMAPVVAEPAFFVVSVGKLFQTLRDNESRQALVQLVSTLSARVPKIAQSAKLLADMNSYEARRLDRYDFERRLAAYQTFAKLMTGSEEALTSFQLLPLVYTFFFDACDDDSAVRSSACNAITTTMQVLCAQSAAATDAVEQVTDGAHIQATGADFVSRYVTPQLKALLKHPSADVREDGVNILAQLVRCMPEQYPDLLLATNSDEDQDIFKNLVHMQKHRRIKALGQLGQLAIAGKLGAASITGFLIPLLLHTVYLPSWYASGGMGKGTRRAGHSERKENQLKGSMANLATAAIGTIGALCGSLPWGKFHRVLSHLLQQVELRPGSEKELLRLICEVIKNFKPPAADGDTVSVQSASIERVLCNRLLPQLFSLLGGQGQLKSGGGSSSQRDTNADGMGVRQPIALGIVSLLRLLPQEQLRKQLPRLVNILGNCMKSHMQSVRDETKDSIVKSMAFLGPEYAEFMIADLCHKLTRGFQRHVLGHTVHAIVDTLVNGETPMAMGALDHCIDKILTVVHAEVVGALSHEKEEESLAKSCREMKSGRAYDTYKLLARSTDFSNLSKLLSPLRNILTAATSLRVCGRVQEALRAIAQGLGGNTSVTSVKTLEFCHKMVIEQLELSSVHTAATSAVREGKYSVSEVVVRQDGKGTEQTAATERANAHYFAEFSLGFAQTQLKSERMDTRDDDVRELLDPYVALVLKCLKSHANKLVQIGLKMLSGLLRCRPPLPSMTKMARPLVHEVFKISSSSSASGETLLRTCYQSLAVIIRDFKEASITDGQLRTLLQLVSTDLDVSSDNQAASLALLKAIVSRKLVTPELYDAMDLVFRMLIRSHNASMRKTAMEILLPFLLDYPLGAKRLKQHLEFLVSNLGYSHDTGREAALLMLGAVVAKFPQEVLQDHLEIIFVSVVPRYVSDASTKCRVAGGALLTQVLKRADKAQYDRFIEFAFRWQADEQLELRRVASHVFSLCVEVEEQGFQRHFDRFLPGLLRDLTHKPADQSTADENAWRLVHSSVSLLEKLMRTLPHVVESEAWQPAWEACTLLLSHPHTWVRLASSRLVGLCLSRYDPAADSRVLPGEPGAPQHIVVQLKTGAQLDLSEIATGLCRQLGGQFLDDTMGQQVVKNLVFIAKAFAAHHSQHTAAEPAGDELDEDADAELASDSRFVWLFNRVARIARGEGAVRKSCCLRWFAVATGLCGKAVMKQVLPAAINAMYRLQEGTDQSFEGRGEFSVELSTLAGQVLGSLQAEIGVVEYNQAYQVVRKQIDSNRQRRAQARNIENVIDPAARDAKRKKRAAKDKASLKRKIADRRSRENR